MVGLDIGSSTIKVCEVDCKGGRIHLRGIAVMETPPQAVANNEIIDPVALGKAIRQVLSQSGIKARKVVTCVAGQTALVIRIIEVPKMTRAELQETMKWEIERHVPFAAEQVVMDYQPLVPPEDVPEGQNMEVLLAVAQEALVVRHVEAIQAAGLQPLAIDIEPLAASRSLLDISNGTGPTGTVAIVDIGASTTDISIYRDGRIAFTRSIQLAGNNLTRAISDVLQRPLAEAEQLKRTVAGVVTQPQDATQTGAFGDDFGAGGLDFGMPGDAQMGGTFGITVDPGAATASDTQTDSMFDIAGQGFSTEAFTTPSAAEPTEGQNAPFGTPASLSGPAPAANPFGPDAGAAPAFANPFESSVFGSVPGGDPFAPPDPFGAAAAAPGPAGPGAMSEEELLKTQIADAIMPILNELVTELRRSLDFYRNRANGLGAQHLVMTGGTARLPGLAEFLSANLEVPVVVGNPLQYLSIGSKADLRYLEEVGPVFPVSVGLAVRELMMDTPSPRKKR